MEILGFASLVRLQYQSSLLAADPVIRYDALEPKGTG